MNRQTNPTSKRAALLACAFLGVVHHGWAQEEETVFELSPFSIDASEDQGYYASQSMAGGRLATDIINTGTSIEVITKDFMDDIAANDIQELLQYTTGTEIGGVLGNFTGAQFDSAQGEINSTSAQRNPDANSRIRGLARPDNSRDFYITDIPFDQYNTERVDINRGSNSFLFGLGSPAGLINGNLAKAHYNDRTKVRFRIGSGGDRPSYRSEIDVNRVLVEDKLAVRVTGMLNRTQYRQRPTYRDDNRIYGAITFNPFENKNTTFRAHWESGSIISNSAATVLPGQNLDTFIEHRIPIDIERNIEYYRQQYGPGVGDINSKRFPEIPDLVGSYWPVYELDSKGKVAKDASGQNIFQRPGIEGLIGAMGNNGYSLVFDGSNGRDVSMVMQNQLRGAADLFDRGTGNWKKVKGQWVWNTKTPGDPFWSPDGRTNGNPSMRVYKNSRSDPSRGIGWYRQGFTDLETFDFSKESLSWDNDFWETKFHNYNFAMEQIFLDGRAGFDIGYDVQNHHREAWTALSAGGMELQIDINQTMPLPKLDENGDVLTDADGNIVPEWRENPNFGRPFVVSRTGRTRNFSDRTALRGTAFYKLDFEEESWMKWLGSHTFTVMADRNTQQFQALGDQLRAFGTDGMNVAQHIGDNSGRKVTTGIRAVGRTVYIGPAIQSYLGDSVWDPNTPLSMSDIIFEPTSGYDLYTPDGIAIPTLYWNKGPDADAASDEEIGARSLINGDEYWANGTFTPRWIPNEGVQTRDTTVTSYAANAQSFFLDKHLVINTGYREDYIDSWLNKNVPKFGRELVPDVSPSVFRPDDPVYGELSEIEGGPDGSGTFGWGAVLHWPKGIVPLPEGTDISFHFNTSKNFVPDNSRLGFYQTGSGDVYLDRLNSPTGKSTDWGVTFQLFDRKVIARLNWYENSLNGATSSVNAVYNQNLVRLFNWYNLNNAKRTLLDSSDQTINGVYDGVISNMEELDANREPQVDVDGEPIIADNTDPDNPIYLMETDQMVIDREWPNWDRMVAARHDLYGILQKGYWQTKLARNRLTVFPDGGIDNEWIAGLEDTEDIVATGFESSITLNPTRNWRMQVNVARQETVASNIAPLLTRFIEEDFLPWVDKYGDLDWNDSARPLAGDTFAEAADENLLKYHTVKSLEGFPSDEVREWRVNLITNYSFREGPLKGFNVGGSARYQSEAAIGYPLIQKIVDEELGSFISVGDIENPWMGEAQMNYDLQCGYTKKLQDVNWQIQLNLRNLNNLDSDALSPIAAQPDGSYAKVRWDPPFQFQLTNTFTF